MAGSWLGPYDSPRDAEAKAKSLRARASEKKIIGQSQREAQMGLFSTAAPAAPASGSYEVRGFSDGWRVYSPRMGAYVVSQDGRPWRSEREAMAAMIDLQRSEAAGPRDASAQLGLFSRGNGLTRARKATARPSDRSARPAPRKGR